MECNINGKYIIIKYCKLYICYVIDKWYDDKKRGKILKQYEDQQQQQAKLLIKMKNYSYLGQFERRILLKALDVWNVEWKCCMNWLNERKSTKSKKKIVNLLYIIIYLCGCEDASENDYYKPDNSGSK